jgi:phage/plasmid-associated DNA primase
LLKKLTTEEELSGFLNWCLEGLRRLIDKNKFSRSRSIEETREQYLRSSDPVKAFAMDRLEYKAGSAIPKSEVYKAFIGYCQEMKLPTVSQTTFAMKLVECMPNTNSTRKRIDGTQTYCWEDLAIGEYVNCAKQEGGFLSTEQNRLEKYTEREDSKEKGSLDGTAVSGETFEEALENDDRGN